MTSQLSNIYFKRKKVEMVELKNEEMNQVMGGSISVTAVIAGAAIITFLAGLISGYTNPVKCND